jgi:hypothetical protein
MTYNNEGPSYRGLSFFVPEWIMNGSGIGDWSETHRITATSFLIFYSGKRIAPGCEKGYWSRCMYMSFVMWYWRPPLKNRKLWIIPRIMPQHKFRNRSLDVDIKKLKQSIIGDIVVLFPCNVVVTPLWLHIFRRVGCFLSRGDLLGGQGGRERRGVRNVEWGHLFDRVDMIATVNKSESGSLEINRNERPLDHEKSGKSCWEGTWGQSKYLNERIVAWFGPITITIT